VPIDYRLVRSRRRSLELRIYPDRRIEVRAPLRCPQRDIDVFVRSRETWIEKKLQAMPDYQGTPAALRYVDGSTHYFFGEPLTLALRAGRGKALLNDGVLQLAVADPEDAASVERALYRWYRQQAQADFVARLQRLFPPFAARGHRLPALTLRRMRSRWGSLSSRSGMSLNVELVRHHPEHIDYVVVHELCHLEHMDHGDGFKALLTHVMPDWRIRRQALNHNAARW
jgi:hypothetical protein